MSLRSFFSLRPMSPASLERMRHVASEITAAGLTMDCACPVCSTDAAELKRAMGELRSGVEVFVAQVLLTNTARATRQAMLRVATVLGAMEVFHFHRAMADGMADLANISAEAAKACREAGERAAATGTGAETEQALDAFAAAQKAHDAAQAAAAAKAAAEPVVTEADTAATKALKEGDHAAFQAAVAKFDRTWNKM